MRLILAAVVAVLAAIPPVQAARSRDGFGTSSRCHCDRYLNPHYTDRGRQAPSSGGYRGGAVRRY